MDQDREQYWQRRVRRLEFLMGGALVLLSGVLASGLASAPRRARFEEIDVERINVVEADGQLRMVLSNRARQHPGIVDGKLMPRPQGRPPGLIFFNHRGDECGGLIFDENGGQGHFVSLTFDKSRQDQTIGLQHLEGDDGAYSAALRIWDRPHISLADTVTRMEELEALPAGERNQALGAMQDAGEFGAPRLWVGKGRDRTASVVLSDAKGRPRLRLAVDADGEARLEFLDEHGEVELALPDDF